MLGVWKRVNLAEPNGALSTLEYPINVEGLELFRIWSWKEWIKMLSI